MFIEKNSIQKIKIELNCTIKILYEILISNEYYQKMTFRLATIDDLNILKDIYNYARQIMRDNGNYSQWINGYPSTDLLIDEIKEKHLYVCENKNKEILAAFSFISGEDPTYKLIENGAWLNDDHYYVIHRLATSGKQKGIATDCFNWCFQQCPNIRVDTHEDNHLMQHVLEKNGFIRCGIIYTFDVTPRLAYQKTLNKK